MGEEFKEVISIDTTLHSNINFSSAKRFSSYHNASLDISNADEKINNDNQKIIQVMDVSWRKNDNHYNSLKLLIISSFRKNFMIVVQFILKN